MRRLAAWLLAAAGLMQGQAPKIGGCEIFCADHIWNTRVDGLPVHERSV